jgi:hypothetical protein
MLVLDSVLNKQKYRFFSLPPPPHQDATPTRTISIPSIPLLWQLTAGYCYTAARIAARTVDA